MEAGRLWEGWIWSKGTLLFLTVASPCPPSCTREIAGVVPRTATVKQEAYRGGKRFNPPFLSESFCSPLPLDTVCNFSVQLQW